jgi:hypothetical protein
MVSIRFTFLTLVLFSLAATLSPADKDLYADEQPDAMKPLQILEDCIKAAEAGDFARYVDHLSSDEQKLQAGYILYMTRTTSRSIELGSPVPDPETLLVARTMLDLLDKHVVPESERKAEHHAAAKILGQLTGEVPIEFNAPHPNEIGNRRDQTVKSAEVLKDARRFLVEALEELARPTDISGEKVPRTSPFFDLGELIEHTKDLKWTLYTRSEYAVAKARQAETPPKYQTYQPRAAVRPALHVEFERLDGQWKVTRLLPTAVVFPSNRMASVNSQPSQWWRPQR